MLPGRLLPVIGLLLAASLAPLIGLFFGRARRALPKVAGVESVAGLGQSVEVLRDAAGIAHIYASSVGDLFFAQGYVAAQDRLWQMELNRRTAAGRLSEVFGPKTVDVDRLFRVMGLARAARLEEASLSSDLLAYLQAYSDGVNAYVGAHRDRLPVEFGSLFVTYEPWCPVDCLAWSKMLAWQLSSNWPSELLRAQLIAKLGPERAAELMPSVPPGHVPHVPAGIALEGLGLSVLRQFDRVLDFVRPTADGLGSNNWVVSGALSAAGQPLLANDTHLGLQHPALWYEVHLNGGGLDVAGFSLPGTPGVVVGHNRRIAWGVTNLGADVQDLFVERRHAENPSLFLFQGQWEEALLVREEIKVRGRRRPLVLDIPWTRHGPVLNFDQPREAPLAFGWTALRATPMAASILALNQADNWQDFRRALADFAVPAQYFVYADVDGHIGLQATGAIPVRPRGDGLLPVPGWTGEYEWQGVLPFAELPSIFDPAAGLLITANDLAEPTAHKHVLTYEWAADYRAARIRELLDTGAQLTLADMERTQLDLQSGLARSVMPILLGVLEADPPLLASATLGAAVDILRAWDYQSGAESAAALIFNVFYNRLLREMLADELGVELLRHYLASHRHHVLAIPHLLADPTASWFGGPSAPRVRGRNDVLRRSFVTAVAALERRFGPDPIAWRWGDIHTAHFSTPLGRVPLLDRLLNRGPYSRSGDTTTVNVSGYSHIAPYAENHHAALRQVFDLVDWDSGRVVIPTGQSGHFLSPHYDDQLTLWLRGEYVTLPFSREAVSAGAASRLLLQPTR
ncbi:MAG: penicillin acylase family protein [Chloroflexota bacterium]